MSRGSVIILFLICRCKITCIDFLSWCHVVSLLSLRPLGSSNLIGVVLTFLCDPEVVRYGVDHSWFLVLIEKGYRSSIPSPRVVWGSYRTCGCLEWWPQGILGVSSIGVDSLNRFQEYRHEGVSSVVTWDGRNRVRRWRDTVEPIPWYRPHTERSPHSSVPWRS